MAKKKKKEELVTTPVDVDYGYESLSALHGVIHKENHSFMHMSNDVTLDALGKMWKDNMKKNHKARMWKKHGSFVKSCSGIATDKAVVAVGAGSSFNKNKGVLKYIHDIDGVKSWEDRSFLILASNHQFKPLLKMGIVPDFVILTDASDVVYDQLCVDVPEEGKGSVLIAPFHGSAKVMKKWTKQGRTIRFYVAGSKKMREGFEKIVGKRSHDHAVVSGGNVMNTAWMFGARVFGSSVFMCVGNDLSFAPHEDKKERETGYYADGDYSSNAVGTGTGRNEAACDKKWLSYKLQERKIIVDGQNPLEIVGGDVVGTSHTLWVYKTWMEEAMLMNMNPGNKLHYYNCTEGGILGVMAKTLDDDEMKKDENWYMMDDVCPRWHTTTLEHATTQFLQAKEQVRAKNSGGIISDYRNYG